ncbi:MAG TPA: hypothetical protein VFI73_09605 [Candidatus Nitrosopolaris sp.]|nr:hypothetical protein [Candidatus Nitrosopolaris sp.]
MFITISSFNPNALALVARPLAIAPAPAAQQPSSTQKFAVYVDSADNISIQYPSNWQKIEYPSLSMSPAAYRVVVNFLAPIVNASDQWREYLMIQVGKQSIVGNLVPQANITLGGNPGYKLVYTNNEETFHLKTLETWTTIGGNTYLLIYKAEASKYSSYLPIVQKMLDSFKIGGSTGASTNATASALKSVLPNFLSR